jgi:hypothetical protein
MKEHGMARTTAVCVLVAAAVAGGCSQPNPRHVQAQISRYELASTPQLALGPGAEVGAANVRTDAADAGPTWLTATREMARYEAQRAEAGAASRPGVSPVRVAPTRTEGGYVHWRQRHGPAYPNDFWPSLGRYGKEYAETLWDDTKATATNPLSLVLVGAAGATGIALRASEADDKVESHYTRHGSRLNTFWDSVGDAGGNPGTHFAVTGAWFLTALACQDKDNYEKANTMLHALALNGLTTWTLKACARTESPNGDEFGWPSGHASSSFTFATVLYEEYGPWLGIPAFAFAGYVGYERIDARNHDFSDVISGALIGIAIGHAVAQNHKPRVFGMTVAPYVDPASGSVGVALGKDW